MTVPLPHRHPFDPEGDSVPSDLADRVGKGEVVVLAADPGPDGWCRSAALALARTWSARTSRLLLMDLDLDAPGLHAALDVENGEGASDLFLFGSSVRRVARPVDGGAFHLVPAGTAAADPGAILEHPRWEGLVRGFREAEVTLLLYLPAGSSGADAVLERADRIVVLEGRHGPENAELAGVENAVIGVLERPAGTETAAAPPPSGEDVAPGTAPGGERIVDIAELAPDGPAEVVDIAALAPEPDPAPASGVAGAPPPGEKQEPGDRKLDVVDIEDLAPDLPGEEEGAPPVAADPDTGVGGPPEAGPPGEEVVDIEDLAPDPAAPGETGLGAGLAPAGPEAETASAEGEEAGAESPGSTTAPGPAETFLDEELEDADAFGWDGMEDLELRIDDGEAEPAGPAGELPDPPAEPEPGGEEAGEDETPGFGDDLVTGPDFGGGAPDESLPDAGPTPEGAGAAAPDVGDADVPGQPEGHGGELDPASESATVEADAAAPANRAEGDRQQVEVAPEGEPGADRDESERLERLERKLRRRRSPRRAGRVVLVLGLLLLVAGAAFAAHWYGLVHVPGLDGALAELLGPGRTGPAPTVVTEGRPPASPVLTHSLLVDEYREPGAATEVATALGQRLPDHLFVVAPVEAGSEVVYRLLAGPAGDAGEAENLRTDLAGVLSREDPGQWDVRSTPLAFLVDELGTASAARVRADQLAESGLPAYTLRVSYPDAADRFRVYAGAYDDEQEARAMQGLLARAGFDDAMLTERRGELPE